MNSKKLKLKHILGWGVSLSLFFNLIWIGIFTIVANFYVERMVFISLFFLLIYIFIAQPLKDWLYTYLISRFIFTSGARSSRLEQQAHSLTTMSEIYSFLSELVKFWRQPGMRFVLYKPNEQILFISKSGHGKWIPFRKPELNDLVNYLKENSWAANVETFPGEIRSYLYNRSVRSVAPVMFRDTLLGFLGFATALKPSEIEFAEFIARRISVVIENDLLKQNIPRSNLINKEFSLARRVESFLMLEETIHSDNYTLNKIKEKWNQKYFPAMLSFGQTEAKISDSFFNAFWKNHNKENSVVSLLCRLAHRPHRANAIQLFVIKGYFLAIAQRAQSASEISNFLQQMILNHEAGHIALEGFIIVVEGINLEINYFGKGLKLLIDGNWRELPVRPPLGSAKFRNRKVKLRSVSHVEFSIKNYSLLSATNNKNEIS